MHIHFFFFFEVVVARELWRAWRAALLMIICMFHILQILHCNVCDMTMSVFACKQYIFELQFCLPLLFIPHLEP